jgi:hypothetical protein
MSDNAQVDRIYQLGTFNSTFTIEAKMGIKAFTINALQATNVSITGNVTTLGNVASTPIVLNNTKPPLTISALSNGSYLDGITINCTVGTADIIMII